MPLKPDACLLLKYRLHYLAIAILVVLFLSMCTVQNKASKARSVIFKKYVISNTFVSEGVAVGDVNRDGRTDIMAGHYWFEAPSWQRHLLHTDTLNPVPGYSTTFSNYSADVNEDGWVDFIRIDQPGGVCVWYENPKNLNGLWESHLIIKNQGNESPAFVDVDGDGRKDIICNDNMTKQMLWLKAPGAQGNGTWQRFIISRDPKIGTDKYTHGLGWGDMNKDGKNDVILKTGWWESPADVQATDWTFHKADLGNDCSNMFALDVDKDGDQDVLSSSAHNYGIWWHEQQQNGTNGVQWVTHEIDKRFSQSHSLALEDMNGDGQPDLVTGKRYWAHNGKDPGEYEPAVLYWFEYISGASPKWIPHEIDNNSGVGTNLVAGDINSDSLPDIVISNKKGVFFFAQVNNRN